MAPGDSHNSINVEGVTDLRWPTVDFLTLVAARVHLPGGAGTASSESRTHTSCPRHVQRAFYERLPWSSSSKGSPPSARSSYWYVLGGHNPHARPEQRLTTECLAWISCSAEVKGAPPPRCAEHRPWLHDTPPDCPADRPTARHAAPLPGKLPDCLTHRPHCLAHCPHCKTCHPQLLWHTTPNCMAHHP